MTMTGKRVMKISSPLYHLGFTWSPFAYSGGSKGAFVMGLLEPPMPTLPGICIVIWRKNLDNPPHPK